MLLPHLVSFLICLFWVLTVQKPPCSEKLLSMLCSTRSVCRGSQKKLIKLAWTSGRAPDQGCYFATTETQVCPCVMSAFFDPVSDGEYSGAAERFTEQLIKRTALLPCEERPRLELWREESWRGIWLRFKKWWKRCVRNVKLIHMITESPSAFGKQAAPSHLGSRKKW